MNRIELIASGSRCITVHLWQVVSSHLVSYPHATLQCARNWKLMRAPQRDRRGTWTIPGHPAGRQFWRRLWSTHESLAQPCISEPIATTTWTGRQTDRHHHHHSPSYRVVWSWSRWIWLTGCCCLTACVRFTSDRPALLPFNGAVLRNMALHKSKLFHVSTLAHMALQFSWGRTRKCFKLFLLFVQKRLTQAE